MSRVVPIQSNINTDQTFFASAQPTGVEVGAPDPNLVVSTLLAADWISTPQAFVSSVNGAFFPPLVAQDQVVSTLLAGVYVSTPELYISSINAQAYPPPVPNDIVVSSIVANTSATVDNLLTSSINGVSYPPITQSPDITVSTLYANSTLSAAQIITSQMTGISSINALTITNVNNLQCSSINGVNTNLLVPPTNTNVGSAVVGGGGSVTVTLTNLFAGAPNFGAWAGYIVPSVTANVAPVADFDQSGAPISTVSFGGSPGVTLAYIAIGQIIS